MSIENQYFLAARQAEDALHNLCAQVRHALPEVCALYEYLGRRARVAAVEESGDKSFTDRGPLFAKRFQETSQPLLLVPLHRQDAQRKDRYASLYNLPWFIPYLQHRHRIIIKADQADTPHAEGLRLLQGVYYAYQAEQNKRVGKENKALYPTPGKLDEEVQFYCLASRILSCLHPQAYGRALELGLAEVKRHANFQKRGSGPEIRFSQLPYYEHLLNLIFNGRPGTQEAANFRQALFQAIVYMHAPVAWCELLMVPSEQRRYLESLYYQEVTEPQLA